MREWISTIRTFSNIFRYTRNPWSILYHYFRGDPFLVEMKDGMKINNVKRGTGKLGGILNAYRKKWKVIAQDDEGLLFSNGKIKLWQPHAGVLIENLNVYHCFDYRDKNVLDIGGYFGETAIFFKMWGAKKVFVFEPIKEHIEIIKRNVKLNELDKSVKIYHYAVSKRDGKEILESEAPIGSSGFGLKGGKFKIEVNCISWSSLLKQALEWEIDIIKVDCEGCEEYLSEVDDELLKNFKKWVIETHSKEIEEKIRRKFLKNGFKMILLEKVNKGVNEYKIFKGK